MIAATALILMLNTAAPPAPAQDDAAKAKAAFQWAQKLYKQARYPEAIEKFEEAYRLKPHPSIFFNIGRCYEQLSEMPKALRNYREYLKAMPDAKDKETVSDAIVNLERRLKDQGVQQLLVYTDPQGAAVTVDGKKYGTTPTSLELRPGNHNLTLTKDGFDAVDRAFLMPADKSMELSFGLKAGSAKPAELPAAQPTVVAKPIELPPPPPTPPPVVTVEASSSHTLRGKSWIPAAAGGVLLITGGVFYGMAKGSESRLRNGDPLLTTPADRAALASSGSTQQTLGFVMGGVGIAALAAAATMFFFPTKSEGPTVSVIATPGMGAAVISGEFP